ncbi:O-antigen ligase family protein [Sideroxydans lithotrophicus]|uniref:O-antigen polymerase n=1 Tax=Sideroxydans lithotrophicus (strain ES-1) TaxID=580332 RepID=D5CQ79_SIDLE|nr:O-antigen ligase family protein [Sideroxydans lithotrophicus]ADE13100.1 O-antigen polymerase [Sideroxydans lithotrophicus ES-1]
MKSVQQRYLSIVELSATVLLLAYPTAMIAVKGGMNGVFLLMLLLALAVWLARPNGIEAVMWRSEFTIYTVSMCAMSVAILISQTYLQNYTAHPYDAASRYWLAIPVFLLLQRLRPAVFVVLQVAFPLAAIIGFMMSNDLGAGSENRSGIGTLDLIHFGDLELIFGVLSLFSINWLGRDNKLLRLLKVTGFMLGLLASFESGSRGGWFAIPVFILIYFYFRTSRVSLKMAAASLIATSFVIAFVYLASGTFQHRVNELINDIATFEQGNRDTSTGVRWQLYKAAADIFAHHPIFGVGPEGFALEMQPMLDAGKITPLAAELGRGEVHNDILSKAAGMGIFGLAALLASYFVPFGLFWRATKSTLREVRRAGILGIAFVSGILVFGVTVEFLNLTMATAFYGFTVAVLLAACYNVHYGVQIVVHKPE